VCVGYLAEEFIAAPVWPNGDLSLCK